MNIRTLRASAFAVLAACALPGMASAASTPAPRHAAPRPIPTPAMPHVPLHTEFVVEVNHLGQIVRVKSGKECPNLTFNAQTYGNVLQMFVRRPDGTAVVGMYKVTYDYNPATHNVSRGVALISQGGDWANEEGAVNQMMSIDQHNRERHRSLPGFDQLLKPSPKPTKH